MLEARKDLISDILFIPSTNVPIIKYRHQATDLMVDLSMNTSMSVQSTKLLKAYTDIDPRVAVRVIQLLNIFNNVIVLIDSWMFSQNDGQICGYL